MTLLALRDIRLQWGPVPLLDGIDLTLNRGERVALLGRNGSGKSTLLKIIGGELTADSGEVARGQGLIVSRLAQEVPADTSRSIAEMVADGLLATGDGKQPAARIAAANAEPLDWAAEQRVAETLARMDLDGAAPFAGLSGGMKRRVLLAQALVAQPDLLLLDEPTNHLDLQAIAWLEEFLRDAPLTLVFITHDRALVRTLATRIVELDRGRLTSYPGRYAQYLEQRQALLAAEARADALFDKKLAEEERWIRRGIEARRTRNEGRVRALYALRDEFARRRRDPGQARLFVAEAERSGKLVIEATDIAFGFGDRPIIQNFSTTVVRGDRIGVIGPNGCGKSTLLRVLLGELLPLAGTVRHGTKLSIAYFDQLRETLNLNSTVRNNVADGADWVVVGGQRKHVMGYLQEFLFQPERANQPVSALSGGERNRLLLARLFTREFNLLVLDEPTNDLDAETLELLEEQLLQYTGTLIVVSHDREFLDNTVARTLVFEQDELREYVGGYQDWLRQRPRPTNKATRGTAKNRAALPAAVANPAVPRPTPVAAEPKPAPRKPKLSYAHQHELRELPGRITALETQIGALQAQLADPAFYKSGAESVARATAELARANEALERVFARWAELEP